MSRYPIETNIPAPRRGRSSRWVGQLDDMVERKRLEPNTEPSFLLPMEKYGSSMKTTRSNIYHAARGRGLKIRTRLTYDAKGKSNGLRVWLIGKRT